MTKIKRCLTKEGLLQIEGWARDGLIDEQIAHNMGVTRVTRHNWRKKHPIMDQAVRRGKEVVDREV
ncbi:hypothetical protein NPM19_33335, partial [Bacillus cereus]|nr:hypothetical protein [Bacillus cereus]